MEEDHGDGTAATTTAPSDAVREQEGVKSPVAAVTATATATTPGATATEQDLDPLVAEEIRPFHLPAGERVIESYSCALLPNNLLIHGRLYVTPRFLCFGSWGSTRLVLPLEDVSFIEKANTMVRACPRVCRCTWGCWG